MPGLGPGERPVAADSDALHVYRPNEVPVKIFRLNVSTGRREPWKHLMPSDGVGITDYFADSDHTGRTNLRLQFHS